MYMYIRRKLFMLLPGVYFKFNRLLSICIVEEHDIILDESGAKIDETVKIMKPKTEPKEIGYPKQAKFKGKCVRWLLCAFGSGSQNIL